MKILLIDVTCRQGSTGKIVYDLYNYINSCGDTASVCYGRGDVIDEPGIYKFGLDWETVLHAALARIVGMNGCFSYFSTQRLIKYIKQFQPDCIHIHELHGYFVNIGMLLRYIKKKRIRLIWTFHCEYMYTGKCGYAYDCLKWKTECRSCPRIKEYPKSLLFDFSNHMFKRKKEMLQNLDVTIVAPSKWLADRVKQSFLKDKDIVVIHNGIDTEVFKPRNTEAIREYFNIPKDKKVVLSAAPDIMSERKGGKKVLELAEIMKKDNIQFILVGCK